MGLHRSALAVLLRRRPALGVPRLCKLLPGLPRNSTVAYLRRRRRIQRRRRRRNWRWLHWLVAGAVWAIDWTWLELPAEDRGRKALIVVELHGRTTLALQSVTGECAEEVERVLAALIEQHGAPLVLKLDNGSGFIAERFAEFCERHAITLMHSPVRRPRWNGTCEVSARWAKQRALDAARARGPVERLTQNDLDQAVTFEGTMPTIDDATRERFLAEYHSQLEIVAAQQGVALRAFTKHHVRRSLRRVAAKRALILCHMLTIEGREYHQCLPKPAA